MSFPQIQTRAKTYSKSKNVSNKSRSDRMFDLAVGRMEDGRSQSVGQTKRTTRAKGMKTIVDSGKLLPVIDEKEASVHDYNDYCSFMTLDENHIKKNDIQFKATRCGRGQTQRVGKPKLTLNKRNDKKSEENSQPTEESGYLFVEKKETNFAKIITRNQRKKRMLKKSFQVKKNNEIKEKKSDKDMFDSSIETARENRESPPCIFVQKSPPLLIKEPDVHSSSEDSVMPGDSSGEDSPSLDFSNEIAPDGQPTESSKYTYSYVSTYTYGTASLSQAGNANSPYVPMKKFSQLNSTTKPEKDNISEVEFPGSLSPIVCSSETTPLKKSNKSKLLPVRKQRTKMNMSTEKVNSRPPKCSTILFVSNTVDDNFGFPVALSRIEDMDTVNCCPSDEDDSGMDSGKVENLLVGETPKFSLKQKQNLSLDKWDLNAKDRIRQDCKVIDSENTNVNVNNGIPNKSDKSKKKENVSSGPNVGITSETLKTMREVEKIVDAEKSNAKKKRDKMETGSNNKIKGRDLRKVSKPIHHVQMDSAMKRKSFGVLKTLKRKASRCFSSSGGGSGKKTQRVAFSDVHQPNEQLTMQNSDEERHTAVTNCPPVSDEVWIASTSNCARDQEQPMHDVSSEAATERLDQLMKCCECCISHIEELTKV